jgi:hypothetical protein
MQNDLESLGQLIIKLKHNSGVFGYIKIGNAELTR